MSRGRRVAVWIVCLAIAGVMPLLASGVDDGNQDVGGGDTGGSTTYGTQDVPEAPCPDADGDGYVVCSGCDLPGGKSCGECNDGNGDINPGETEICNGVDDDCDGDTDLADSEFDDPDPIDGNDNDDGGSGDIDEGFGYCVFNEDGPSDECKTGGRSVCVWPAGPVISGVAGFGTLTCQNLNDNIIEYSDEALASGGSCSNGQDDDCDTFIDIDDTGCQQPETGLCDGIDNDNNGQVDDIFPLSDPGSIGDFCEVGVGECERSGTYACLPDGSDAACSAIAGNPKNEGVNFGNSCDNSDDDDCDGLSDLDDPDCAGFGAPELCGNSIDDNGNGFIDEGFPTIGLPCAVGVGSCTNFGELVCNGTGNGTECDATANDPAEESESAGTCADNLDNDCDGLSDDGDADCASAYADLGVTCSLPFTTAYPGGDCTGRHTVVIDGGDSTELTAELLALDADGSIMAALENVQSGDIAHLASRLDPLSWHWETKTNSKGTRHTVWAPMPLLRVVGRKGTNEDVAYCSIMPFLQVLEPKGETISLNNDADIHVEALLPLVDVRSLELLFNGVDLLAAMGIDPETDLPTGDGVLCATAGECTFQITAGCGDGSLVDVEIRNLRVEALSLDDAGTEKDGIEVAGQVNTVSFDVIGLPAGGHIFYLTGSSLPLEEPLSVQCDIDDLTDTGTASAFGISIDTPVDQQVIAAAPVTVAGTACGGNEIASLLINANTIDVTVPTEQTCTAGDGMTTAPECVVDFSIDIDEEPLENLSDGTATGTKFKRASNQVIAEAKDVLGNLTRNTDVVFGLGDVQAPAAATAVAAALGAEDAVGQAAQEALELLGSTIDPAFVVGLEETAVQEFFNEKCSGAIDQFTAAATAALQNKAFGTIDIEPGCSCDLHDVPIVLEVLTFTPSDADPKCFVDFSTDTISVKVNLPSVFIQVGVHDSCTDYGIFGECIAKTKIDVTAVVKIEDTSFEFDITETQIETKTPPSTDSFVFAWTVLDNDDNVLFLSSGTCGNDSLKEGKECFGNAGCGVCQGGDKDGKGCKADDGCPGGTCDEGTCNGVVKNDDFDPITQQESGIECWGATLCTAFQVVGAILIEVFTFGIADGFEIVDFFDFDFEFQEDFFDELTASEPDAMELDEVEADEDQAAQAGNTIFTPGPIDVEIVDGGLTVAFPATFASQSDVSSDDDTPGAAITDATTPTVAEVIAVGDEITMLLADDVFGQIYYSMKEAGQLTAFCTDLDGKTIGDLLPDDCTTISGANQLAAGIRGICEQIKGDLTVEECDALDDLSHPGFARAGCVGFVGPRTACQETFGINLILREACELVFDRNIKADDKLLLCAAEQLEPDLIIHEDNTLDSTVDTDLIMNKLDVSFVLDREADGYAGSPQVLSSCFNKANALHPDCLILGVCLDLTFKTSMGIDSSSCATNEAGFTFAVNDVQGSGISLGLACDGEELDTTLALGQAFNSVVIDRIKDAAQNFTPVFCIEGLDLNGVLDFHSADAKMFGLTTSGATGVGFADYLGLTVGLGVSALLDFPDDDATQQQTDLQQRDGTQTVDKPPLDNGSNNLPTRDRNQRVRTVRSGASRR